MKKRMNKIKKRKSRHWVFLRQFESPRKRWMRRLSPVHRTILFFFVEQFRPQRTISSFFHIKSSFGTVLCSWTAYIYIYIYLSIIKALWFGFFLSEKKNVHEHFSFCVRISLFIQGRPRFTRCNAITTSIGLNWWYRVKIIEYHS